MNSVRIAFRTLVRRPTTSAFAVLSLALGIASTTAILSIVQTVLLRPLPYPEPERVVSIWTDNEEQAISHSRLSPVAFHDFREQLESFDALAGWYVPELNLTDESSEPIRVSAIDVTIEFFDVLRSGFARGTGFDPEDALVFPQTKVVISHALWQSRYGGRDDVVGASLRLDDTAHTVVGVLPAGVDVPRGIDVIRPLGWDPSRHNRGARFFYAIGRLADDVTLEQARAEVDALAREFEEEFASSDGGWSFSVTPLLDDMVRDVRPGFVLLMTAVVLLLLLACFNVAGLLVAAGVARGKELSVRAALGAGRRRLLSQLLLESGLLAAGGAAMGLALAVVLVRAFVSLAPEGVPRLDAARIDVNAFFAALGLMLACTLIAGLVPALRGSRSNPAAALGDSVRAEGSRFATRARAAVVVLEIALATVLLLGAGLLVRSLEAVLEDGPALSEDGVLLVNLSPPASRYDTWAALNGFYEELLDDLATVPGVEQASITGFLPAEAAWRCDVGVLGAAGVGEAEQPQAQLRPVTPTYFESVGLPMVSGRRFAATDRVDSPPVVIANRAFVRRYLGATGQAPTLGQRLAGTCRGFGPLGRILTDDLEVEIVGVVEDEKNTGFVEATEPALYYPLAQFAYRTSNVVLLTDREDPMSMVASVRERIWAMDESLPVDRVQTLEAYLGRFLQQRRFVSRLLLVFAGLSLLFAAIGAYGVLSEMAASRRFEFGLRLALGARPLDLASGMMLRALSLLAVGLVVGSVLAFSLQRLISGQLYAISVLDSRSIVGALVFLTLVAVFAAIRPALRAARVAPSTVLREG